MRKQYKSSKIKNKKIQKKKILMKGSHNPLPDDKF